MNNKKWKMREKTVYRYTETDEVAHSQLLTTAQLTMKN